MGTATSNPITTIATEWTAVSKKLVIDQGRALTVVAVLRDDAQIITAPIRRGRDAKEFMGKA
jgi:hypothetical protein